VGSERTFEHDISSGPALRETLERIIALVWERIERSGATGRTITLKLRLSDFTLLTRARSLPHAVSGRDAFASASHALLDEVLPLPQPARLMGLTLSSLDGPEDKSPSPANTPPITPPATQLSLF